jgi:hypothetical protein
VHTHYAAFLARCQIQTKAYDAEQTQFVTSKQILLPPPDERKRENASAEQIAQNQQKSCPANNKGVFLSLILISLSALALYD